ncbi:MAG TPA: PTS sugar transporter subunit IIA [Anaerovoracaceae bacterium]|nr:PTS sugar transporter subunit IIA [Anaerovoracaceae bacterium]
MKGNCIKLIRIMLDGGEWLTAGFLAGKLGVSERSVKTYIADINYDANNLIASSRKGYRIDAERARVLLKSLGTKFPQTSRERVNYIINRIFTDDAFGGKKTDLYEIGDEIYVSYETIKKDMAKVRKKMLEYDLYLSTANSCVSVEGNELDKRRLLSNILYEEFNDNIISLEVIEKAFPGYDLELLQSIIQEQCKRYHYYINEYALLKLVLDIVIGIYRIKKERTSGRPREENTRFGIREQELARNIATEIERCFQVCYSPAELEELTIILLSHLMKMDFANINSDNIEMVVGRKCVEIVSEIRSLLKNVYFINTDDQDFIIKFTLHIKNLLTRLENGYAIKNPLSEHIKNTCPLIFECAVEVADKLKEITGYEITEDDIAYIAIHIGGNLETQKSKEKLLSCMILFPQYYDFSNKMMKKLKNHYGERIEIKTVITANDQIEKAEPADLLISTIPVQEATAMEWVMVTPFLSDKDYDSIDDKIQKINLRRVKARLKKHLLQISNSRFFCKNANFHSKEEAIRYMTDIMEKEGYVNNAYYDEIFDREKQSSTAFEHIAVPHSMKMNAHKTGMFILLNEKKPLDWGENPVNIVLLFAVNKDERAIFHDVFDNLIVLLLEKANAAKVIGCNSYTEFVEAVLECFH